MFGHVCLICFFDNKKKSIVSIKIVFIDSIIKIIQMPILSMYAYEAL